MTAAAEREQQLSGRSTSTTVEALPEQRDVIAAALLAISRGRLARTVGYSLELGDRVGTACTS